MVMANEVWNIIANLVAIHSEKNIETSEVNPELKIVDLFPTPILDQKYNEHANRFGMVMWDLCEVLKREFNFDLKYDFGPREEWTIFITFEDLWLYTVLRINHLESHFK